MSTKLKRTKCNAKIIFLNGTEFEMTFGIFSYCFELFECILLRDGTY